MNKGEVRELLDQKTGGQVYRTIYCIYSYIYSRVFSHSHLLALRETVMTSKIPEQESGWVCTHSLLWPLGAELERHPGHVPSLSSGSLCEHALVIDRVIYGLLMLTLTF